MNLKICDHCNNGYYIKEEYGLEGHDEYSAKEIGHKGNCYYYMIDPIMRRYIQIPN